jgi:hypothetical protein
MNKPRIPNQHLHHQRISQPAEGNVARHNTRTLNNIQPFSTTYQPKRTKNAKFPNEKTPAMFDFPQPGKFSVHQNTRGVWNKLLMRCSSSNAPLRVAQFGNATQPPTPLKSEKNHGEWNILPKCWPRANTA